LIDRLHRPTPVDAHIIRAVKWTYAERGRLNVRELAREVGLCERQLGRKFLAWTGYTPKQFVRVMRFQHAFEALAQRRTADDATVAVSHGYSDQSHMIRDFQELGGISPGKIRRPGAECPIFSIPTPGTLRYHLES